MIKLCAHLCKQAYKGIQVGNHSFTYHHLPDVTIFAIAGTANLENVLEDVSVWPSLTPTKRLAHAGVINAFKEIENEIEAFIIKDRPVMFTGHSLGGGIAQIFAEKYKAKVITFGALKTYFRLYPAPKLDHIRVVCDDDPVPLVPGILYAHREDPIVLSDHDGGFDVKDHFIDTYIKRLDTFPAVR